MCHSVVSLPPPSGARGQTRITSTLCVVRCWGRPPSHDQLHRQVASTSLTPPPLHPRTCCTWQHQGVAVGDGARVPEVGAGHGFGVGKGGREGWRFGQHRDCHKGEFILMIRYKTSCYLFLCEEWRGLSCPSSGCGWIALRDWYCEATFFVCPAMKTDPKFASIHRCLLYQPKGNIDSMHPPVHPSVTAGGCESTLITVGETLRQPESSDRILQSWNMLSNPLDGWLIGLACCHLAFYLTPHLPLRQNLSLRVSCLSLALSLSCVSLSSFLCLFSLSLRAFSVSWP